MCSMSFSNLPFPNNILDMIKYIKKDIYAIYMRDLCKYCGCYNTGHANIGDLEYHFFMTPDARNQYNEMIREFIMYFTETFQKAASTTQKSLEDFNDCIKYTKFILNDIRCDDAVKLRFTHYIWCFNKITNKSIHL